jgi:uncharacterized membrane protein
MKFKEISKFLAGVAFWDMTVALWCLAAKIYPINFFGINFGINGLIGISIIDALLVIIFVYIGWCVGAEKRKQEKAKRKSQKRIPKKQAKKSKKRR